MPLTRNRKLETETIPSLRITPRARAAAARHSINSYPREGCGAFIGTHGPDGSIQITAAVPLPNIHERRTLDRYEIDCQAYAALEMKLARRARGERVVGFFHSHPAGPARPSPFDLEMAQGLFHFAKMRYVYGIQAVQGRSAGAFTCWRLSEDLKTFIKLCG